MDLEAKTVYFEKLGDVNTDTVLKIAHQRAEELGIETIVIASTTGNTAVQAAALFSGMRVVAVSHSSGFKEPNAQEFLDGNRTIVESKGGIVLTTTHAFAGVCRATRNKVRHTCHRRHNRQHTANFRGRHEGSL